MEVKLLVSQLHACTVPASDPLDPYRCPRDRSSRPSWSRPLGNFGSSWPLQAKLLSAATLTRTCPPRHCRLSSTAARHVTSIPSSPFSSSRHHLQVASIENILSFSGTPIKTPSYRDKGQQHTESQFHAPTNKHSPVLPHSTI